MRIGEPADARGAGLQGYPCRPFGIRMAPEVTMRAHPVVLTPRQRSILEPLSRSRTAPQRVVERATLVLLAANGLADAEIASCLEVSVQRPRRWRTRWRTAAP